MIEPLAVAIEDSPWELIRRHVAILPDTEMIVVGHEAVCDNSDL
jgi:hypothetical protein